MDAYKIVGANGEDNFVNLNGIIQVEFVEEEYLVVFDDILKIKVSPQLY